MTTSEQDFINTITRSVDLRVSGDLAQSAQLATFACDRWPDEAGAWHTLAMVASDLGRHAEALYARERAVRLLEGKEIPEDKRQYVQQCIFGYATSLLLAGRWREAWPYWEAGRLGYSWTTPAGTEYWRGSNAADDSILVVCEGGYGDLFMFSRFLPVLHSLCETRRIGLFVHRGMRDFRDWSALGVDDVYEIGDEFPAGTYKYSTSIMSLPGMLGYNYPLHVPKDNMLASSGFTSGIGFCWRSEEFMTKRRFRSMLKLEAQRVAFHLGDLGPDVYSLSPKGKDLAGASDFINPSTMLYEPERMTSWQATADYIAGMRMVLTVDTAVAHLAGLLGVPTLLLLPLNVDWKFGLTGDTTPWYPSVRLFRNQLPLAWETDRIVETATAMYREIVR